METIILIFSILALVASVYCVTLLLKGKGGVSISSDDIEKMNCDMTEDITKNVHEIQDNSDKVLQASINTISTTFVSTIKPYMDTFDSKLIKLTNDNNQKMNDLTNNLSNSLTQLKMETTESIEKMRQSNENHMKNIQESNDKKLEEMRATVDEKLSSTLDNRISLAFKAVTDSLSNVQKSFGEMTELSKQVGNLNKVFTNVKVRGGWGEVSLGSLLDQILAPEQYERQKQLNPKTTELVDFAIKMPGKGVDDYVYLPVDSKFPTADYERLLQASESGSPDEVQEARKSLFKTIKDEAKSIKQKYILPPTTTNFGIIYLPVEGLYAEIVKDPTLCEDLQKNYQIIPCGPTVLAAMLNSLQVGFTTLKIQKSSAEISKMFYVFKNDFKNFTDLIEKVRKNAQAVVKSLDDVDNRNRIIQKRLSKVDSVAIEVEKNISLEGIVLDNDSE